MEQQSAFPIKLLAKGFSSILFDPPDISDLEIVILKRAPRMQLFCSKYLIKLYIMMRRNGSVHAFLKQLELLGCGAYCM